MFLQCFTLSTSFIPYNSFSPSPNHISNCNLLCFQLLYIVWLGGWYLGRICMYVSLYVYIHINVCMHVIFLYVNIEISEMSLIGKGRHILSNIYSSRSNKQYLWIVSTQKEVWCEFLFWHSFASLTLSSQKVKLNEVCLLSCRGDLSFLWCNESLTLFLEQG